MKVDIKLPIFHEVVGNYNVQSLCRYVLGIGASIGIKSEASPRAMGVSAGVNLRAGIGKNRIGKSGVQAIPSNQFPLELHVELCLYHLFKHDLCNGIPFKLF